MSVWDKGEAVYQAAVSLLKRHWPLVALAVLFVAVGGWFAWQKGSFAEREVYVVRRGDLVDEVRFTGESNTPQRATLSFERGGVVRFVVPAGTHVKAGAIVARLAAQEAAARVANAEAVLQAEEANLEKLLRGARPEVLSRARTLLADAEAALQQRQVSLRSTARKVKESVRNTISTFLDPLFHEPDRTQRKLKFKTTRSVAADKLRTARGSVGDLLQGMEDAIHALEQARIPAAFADPYQRLKASLTSARRLFTLADEALSGAIITLDAPQEVLEQFRSLVTEGLVRLTATEVELDGAYDAFLAAQQARDTAREELTVLEAGSDPKDIAAARARVASQRALLAQARAELARYYIVAPFSGVIGAVYKEAGDRVQPFEPVLELLSDGGLIVEGQVSELDVPFLERGQEVRITFDALGEGDVFLGKVVQLEQAERRIDGTPTYKVEIALLDEDSRIVPGMTANVESRITRAEGVLLLPKRFLWFQHGKPYVWVRGEGGRLQMRPVRLGRETRSGIFEVLDGVAEGDRVIAP